MWVLREPGYVSPQLELSLDEHKVSEGSIGCNRDGTTFAFTIAPVSETTMAGLLRAAETRGRLCLYCCRQPLVVELVTLERKGPRGARIVGRVVPSVAEERYVR